MKSNNIRSEIEKILNTGFVDVKSQRFSTGWPTRSKPKIHPPTSTKDAAIDDLINLFRDTALEVVGEDEGTKNDRTQADAIRRRGRNKFRATQRKALDQLLGGK